MNYVWDGGGVDGNWTTGANWNPDLGGAPPDVGGPFDSWHFGGVLQLNSNNDAGGNAGGRNTGDIV
ncbi:MAG: hypothetical protein KDA41_02400, partial [Planctomycetales bacterium]|nr:hypothetical protein [Planctomycetales bacterium]